MADKSVETPDMELRPAQQARLSRRGFLGALGALALGGAAVLAGCSKDGDKSASDSGMSDDLKIAESAGRVVVFGETELVNLFELGVVPAAVALPDNLEALPASVTDFFGPMIDINSFPVVGNYSNPDIAAIEAVDPTLIIASDNLDQATVEKLQALAPVVTTPSAPEKWQDNFRAIATAIEKEDEADSKLLSFQSRAEMVTGMWQGEAPSLSMLNALGPGFTRVGDGSFAALIAQAAGLANFGATGPVEPAQFGELDGQYLVYAFNEGNDPAALPEWAAIPAVQAEHAYPVEGNSWFMSTSYPAAMNVISDIEHLMHPPMAD